MVVIAGAKSSIEELRGPVIVLPPGDGEAALRLWSRYYNPEIGQFNKIDPFEGDFEDPQSLNKYSYVHGDPVNNVDPSGQFIAQLLIGAGGFLGSGAVLGFAFGGLSAVAGNDFWDGFGSGFQAGSSIFFASSISYVLSGGGPAGVKAATDSAIKASIDGMISAGATVVARAIADTSLGRTTPPGELLQVALRAFANGTSSYAYSFEEFFNTRVGGKSAAAARGGVGFVYSLLQDSLSVYRGDKAFSDSLIDAITPLVINTLISSSASNQITRDIGLTPDKLAKFVRTKSAEELQTYVGKALGGVFASVHTAVLDVIRTTVGDFNNR